MAARHVSCPEAREPPLRLLLLDLPGRQAARIDRIEQAACADNQSAGPSTRKTHHIETTEAISNAFGRCWAWTKLLAAHFVDLVLYIAVHGDHERFELRFELCDCLLDLIKST